MRSVSEGDNHKAINIGSLEELSNYSYPHPKLNLDVEGKLFIGEVLKTTGAEMSIQELPANTSIPFLHQHDKHEEIYIFLKGFGKFQVDEHIFDISEGSIVRVSPNGSRCLQNNSDNKMIYMVVQSCINSLNGYDISDGFRVDGDIKLK